MSSRPERLWLGDPVRFEGECHDVADIGGAAAILHISGSCIGSHNRGSVLGRRIAGLGNFLPDQADSVFVNGARVTGVGNMADLVGPSPAFFCCAGQGLERHVTSPRLVTEVRDKRDEVE